MPADDSNPATDGFQACVDVYKKDIDRTLLREHLKLTVQRRFEKFERMMELHDELRRAGEALRRRARSDPS